MMDVSRFPTVLVVLTVMCVSFQRPLRGQDVVHEDYSVEQLTFGPSHHLFGYIGHAGTIPWNASGRFIVALRSPFLNHMPELDEPADVVLLDTENDYRVMPIEQTRAWNPQQGTMLYWNPQAPETQFFFNDRDPQDGTLFTVLFDISRGESGQRVREYRYPDSPVANSGVAQSGDAFLALNYGRLARLRLVTGYAGLSDWSESDNAPNNDGIFKIDVDSGKRTLLVSYRQLRDMVRDDFADIQQYGLFINHTLWNRPSERIYFYLRANFRSSLPKVDVPFTINSDGSGLTRHQYIGGHPEWDRGNILMGADGDRQIRYDTSSKRIVGTLGAAGSFPDPGGDVAWSPNGEWFINGHKRKDLKQTFFTLFREPDQRVIQTRGFSIGDFLSGELRIDPAPRWNRDSSKILFGAFDPKSETRQLFLLKIHGL
jgi:hypothetical protein